MRDHADGLRVAETADEPSVEQLEDAAFGLHRRVRRLIEQSTYALVDPAQNGLDESFLSLLLLASLSGLVLLVLLVLRDRTVLTILLIVHLGMVMALFVTLPYGKFVHGSYRLAALVKYHLDSDRR